MKTDIHPEYQEARIVCACGSVIETRSTVEEIHVEICSSCHPFFTGKQKLVDTAGRVEKFRAKYGLAQESDDAPEETEELDPAERARALQEAREELAEESGDSEKNAEEDAEDGDEAEETAEAVAEAPEPAKKAKKAKKSSKKKKAAKVEAEDEPAAEEATSEA